MSTLRCCEVYAGYGGSSGSGRRELQRSIVRDPDRSGPQWRRQDHPDEGLGWTDSAVGRNDRVRRRQYPCDACASSGAARHRLCAAGATHHKPADGLREPNRRHPRAPLRGRRGAGGRAGLFPYFAGTLFAEGRNALRRPAANARYCPRPGGTAQTTSARRAVRGRPADPSCSRSANSSNRSCRNGVCPSYSRSRTWNSRSKLDKGALLWTKDA